MIVFWVFSALRLSVCFSVSVSVCVCVEGVRKVDQNFYFFNVYISQYFFTSIRRNVDTTKSLQIWRKKEEEKKKSRIQRCLHACQSELSSPAKPVEVQVNVAFRPQTPLLGRSAVVTG